MTPTKSATLVERVEVTTVNGGLFRHDAEKWATEQGELTLIGASGARATYAKGEWVSVSVALEELQA